MQIFELFGSILLKDNASSQLDAMDKKASSTGKSMGLSFSSIAGAALKLGAALGVGLGLKEIITSAAASQQTLAQMDAVLKSTGGSAGMTKTALLSLADAQGKVTTFSKGTTVAAENLLLTFTGISSKTFPATIVAAQNMSTALGTDLNSSVMLLGKSMNDPVAGMTKLTKSGVTFTAQQKEQIKTMQAAGNTAGAQKIILAELDKEFGGSAIAAGKTFNGQVTILKNGLIGMGVSIGSTVIPYLTTFATTINNNMPKIKQVITDMVNAIVPKFQDWIKLIIQIVQELLPKFGSSVDGVKGKTDIFKTALNDVTSVLTFLKDNIGLVKLALDILGIAWIANEAYIIATNAALVIHNATVIAKNVLSGIETAQIWLLIAADTAQSIATGIATTATALFSAATLAAIIPIVLIIAALVLLGIGIYEIVTHWNTVKAKTIEVWDAVKTYLSGVFNDIKGFIAKWGPDILVVLAPFLGIPLIIYQHWTQISKDLTQIWSNVKSTVSSGVSAVSSTVVNGFNGAISFIEGLPGKAVQWGKDFIQGLTNGITSMIGGITNAVSGVATTIKSFLHFSTPDTGDLKDYESWMPDFMNGMAKGIDTNKFKVIDSIKNLTSDMKVNATVATDDTTTTANSTTNDSKTPTLIQLILQNGKVIAEYLIDDINKLQGTKTVRNGRGLVV